MEQFGGRDRDNSKNANAKIDSPVTTHIEIVPSSPPERLLLGPRLGLERGLHGVERARMVLLGVVELLLLLLDPAVDLLPHLVNKIQNFVNACREIFSSFDKALSAYRRIIISCPLNCNVHIRLSSSVAILDQLSSITLTRWKIRLFPRRYTSVDGANMQQHDLLT